MICVRDGSGAILSLVSISPPLTGKRDVFLYLSHVLQLLELKRSSDAGSNRHCLLSCP